MMFRKCVAGVIAASIVLSVLVTPFRAQAFLGIADISIVNDPIGWGAAAAQWVWERAFPILLETLKKRILDTIVDQIIVWIQGGGEPRFLSDFGSVVTNSFQYAVGDTVREIGLGELCDRRLSLQLRVGARKSGQIHQSYDCNLDDVVGNISAFTDNFESGGWVGYQALHNPQNNRFGLSLIMMDRMLATTEAQEKKATLEAQAYQGFSPTKRCTLWRRVVEQNGGIHYDQTFTPTDAPGEQYYDPTKPPPDTITPDNPVSDIVSSETWRCDGDNSTEVTIPGTVAKEGVDRGVFSDIDYIVNSQELSTYASAILDAVINRLVFEGVQGLRGLSKSQTGGGTLPSGWVNPGTGTAGALPPELEGAKSGYESGQRQALEQSRGNLIAQIDSAIATARDDNTNIVAVQQRNSDIRTDATNLEACLIGCGYGGSSEVLWAQAIAATAQSNASELALLDTGASSIQKTIVDLQDLKRAVLDIQATTATGGANPTAMSDLAKLDTTPITTANNNHAKLSNIDQYNATAKTELDKRIGYCRGEYVLPGATDPVPSCTRPQ